MTSPDNGPDEGLAKDGGAQLTGLQRGSQVLPRDVPSDWERRSDLRCRPNGSCTRRSRILTSQHGSLSTEADSRKIDEVATEVDSRESGEVIPSGAYPLQQPSDASEWDAIGKQCMEDCAGHVAGYQCDEEKGIEHPDDCGGNSQSFIEGCEAYAESVQRESISRPQCDDWDGDGLCD